VATCAAELPGAESFYRVSEPDRKFRFPAK